MTAIPDSTALAQRFAAQIPPEAPHTGLCWLEHEGVISVEGPDSARFLQGQVTCDIKSVQPWQSTLGARCNPKGRMQASFRLVCLAEDQYLLVLHRELVERQIAELKKYAVFFKTELRDESDAWLRLGVYGDAAERILSAADLPWPGSDNQARQTAAGMILRLASDTAEVWLRPDQAQQQLDRLADGATPLATPAWLLHQIRAGVGQVFPQTCEAFIPQMLNLQQLGGVSFRKGCYTGQEIVARMQYLGKLKRRMYRALLAGETPPPPGTPIVNRETGQTVGEIVMAARSESMVEVLAVLQKDAAQLATLIVGDSEGPLLSLASLPYDAQLEASEADKEQ